MKFAQVNWEYNLDSILYCGWLSVNAGCALESYPQQGLSVLPSCPGGNAGGVLWNVGWGLSKSFCLEQKHIRATSADDANLGLKIKDPMEIL